jgi:hypothetical protein
MKNLLENLFGKQNWWVKLPPVVTFSAYICQGTPAVLKNSLQEEWFLSVEYS